MNKKYAILLIGNVSPKSSERFLLQASMLQMAFDDLDDEKFELLNCMNLTLWKFAKCLRRYFSEVQRNY